MSPARRLLLAVMALFFLVHSQRDNALTSEQIRILHTKIDSSGDGKMSLQELMAFSSAMRKKHSQASVDEMDGDKDGKLSLPELLKHMEQKEGTDDNHESLKFTAADANADGVLDGEEIYSFFHPGPNDGVTTMNAERTLQQKDVDGDLKLTSQEFWDGIETISEDEEADFQKLDTNGDGFVNLEELNVWESGHFHTEGAMQSLIDLSDKDGDMHVTADEFHEAQESIAAQISIKNWLAWAEHQEL